MYWEDVAVGSEITTLPKVATTQMLVKWAGATGDFNPLHYEYAFAQSQGVGRPIVHGQLKRAWLVQMLTRWAGEEGFLVKFACQFRGVDYPVPMMSSRQPADDRPTHWCRGKITGKYAAEGKHYVECEVWVENAGGERTTLGSALLLLPTRGAAG